MTCKASDAEYKEVNCQRERDSCRMCCIYHVCEHNWETREVWRTCEHFLAGSCMYRG
ncbi:MAG: hypothetical protein GXN98_04685 [Euryarchaeota archaeon]|nr:hypothetical protein [Euryarchaeota archaeon]